MTLEGHLSMEDLRMPLPWKRSGPPPIAADLGVDAIRLVQLDSEDLTSVATATESPLPNAAPFDLSSHLEVASHALKTISDDGPWRGRRLVVALPAAMVSMAYARIEADEDPQLIAQSRFPDLAEDLTLRTIDLPANGRTMRSGRDVLLLAMSRASVLRYVEMIHDLKFEVAAVYSPASMMVRAFAHLNRRERDTDSATLYVDLDQHGTTAAIGHGRQMVLARRFDTSVCTNAIHAAPRRIEQSVPVAAAESPSEQQFLATLNRRQGAMPDSMASLPVGDGVAGNKHTTEIVEELQLCLRHHRSLFDNIEVGRVVFTGTAATEQSPCRQLARSLGVPAVVGDPLGQWNTEQTNVPIDNWHQHIRPQWAIAAGLAGTTDGSNRT